MDRQRIEQSEARYRNAVGSLALKRVNYAREWQFNRHNSKSDWEATQKTIESTGDAITMQEAEVYIARRELELAYAESKES